ALLCLAACGSSADNGGSSPLDTDSTGKRDAGRADAKVDARTSTPVPCGSSDTDDADKDGFSKAAGDCNDCDEKVNPAAYDYPTDSVDDDCSGDAARSTDAPCDEGLAIDSSDAQNAARSIGLCSFSDESSKAWGVLSARFTNATGTGSITDPLAAGLLPKFGAVKPSQGDAFLALSSGVARAPDQEDYTSACDTFGSICVFACSKGGAAPAGYPKESSSCKSAGNIFQLGSPIFNQSALELTIRVPSNASSLSFDSIFYTSEYPNFICSQYNDFFAVFKEPKPDGVSDGNIVFDSNGDPIGVNTGLLAVCDPTTQSPTATKQFACEGGTALLKGTGYGAGENTCDVSGSEGGASTGWLHTTAPVKAGEVITIRFAIWDTNDPNLDSTVLIDNFAWSEDDSDVGTTPILI
ncbi:MAG TPA: choice-of-anchor L domain-containing protein, partial [Polyangiales bacterium]|nr:choice-of-anchor L domain-containing protein [Polyangiales bacterium]